MKTRTLTLFAGLLAYSLLIAFSTTAQQSKYERQATPIRVALPSDKQVADNGYSTKFDTATKKFRVSMPGRPVMEYPQPLELAKNKRPEWSKHILSSLNPNFHLVKDINSLSESYPSNYTSNKYPSSFAVLNNISYFSANDGIHGSELWRSDGTAAGTYMVKDINTGEASSGIYEITVANGKLVFSATTAGNGQEPWVSDGTESGTQQLMDIGTGTFSSYPTQFVNIGNTVFFVSTNSGYNNELWKTDGTTTGTLLVKNLQQNTDYTYAIFESAAANELLFFTAYSFTQGRELWRSDGTDAGTFLVKDITPDQGESNSPMQLTEYNNKLYFSADNGTGRKLWVSDGTAEGTTYAPGNNDILMQTDYISFFTNQPFAIMNNVLYLAGYTNSSGSGLYKYDALNAPGLTVVKDLTVGTDVNFIAPSELRAIGNSLYFKVISATGGYHDELWTSMGNASNTKIVKSFIPGELTQNYYNGYGTLYFTKYDAAYGNELWKSNGTEQGTELVKDINNGSGSSFPYFLAAIGDGRLLFNAVNLENGAELWLTDGTGEGTSIVKDINQTTTSGSSPAYLVNFNNTLLFSAGEIHYGYELWKSNGRFGGTSLVKDIVPGAAGSSPFALTSLKNSAYFFIQNPTQLWKTDGTDVSTSVIKDFSGNSVSYGLSFPDLIVAADNQVFFSIYNTNTGKSELWRSNGTEEGTNLLKVDLGTYTGGSAVVDNTIFFSVMTDTSAALWKSDGTVSGTVSVKSFQPNIFYEVDYLYPFDGKVFFNADDINGYGLWKSDGTEAGTVFVKNLFRPGIYGHAESNGVLYFDAEGETNGRQLWKTDGTTNGTKMVKAIAPYGSYPENLTDVNGILYFSANDDIHGRELWKSDGTEAGTQLVKDITPGGDWTNFSSYPGKALVNGNGKLFFKIFDPSFANVNLWESDGTEEGTKAVQDKALANVTYISYLTAVGSRLFFAGNSYRYGAELYTGSTKTWFKPAEITKESNLIKSSIPDAFSARLLTNPIKDELKFTVNVKEQQRAQIIVVDASGRTLRSHKETLSPGTNTFSYNTQAWSPGMYMVKIVAADGTSSLLKAIK